MKIWLVTIGEPLPVDPANQRLLRTGILAGLLADAGHTVTWWTSAFDHVKKVHRSREQRCIRLRDNYSLVLLRAPGYRSNVSFARIWDHYSLGRRFAAAAAAEERPDIILCSLPTPELALVSTRLGERWGIPVVLDARDLWPDEFLDLLPAWARPATRAVLTPYYRMTRAACAKASAITGITPGIVDWALGFAGRVRGPRDRAFPMGYTAAAPKAEEVEAARRGWVERHGLDPEKQFILCFFGIIGHQFDIGTVIEAAEQLRDLPVRFVLCGEGDNLATYRERARGLASVIFPGWVNRADIWSLMRLSSAGLAPYAPKPSFLMSLPNKVIEYLSAGLPVVSAIDGSIGQLLTSRGCGLVYRTGDSVSLADTLRRLYGDHTGREEMSHNALTVYREQFVAEKVYAGMIDYLEIIAGHRAASGPVAVGHASH